MFIKQGEKREDGQVSTDWIVSLFFNGNLCQVRLAAAPQAHTAHTDIRFIVAVIITNGKIYVSMPLTS